MAGAVENHRTVDEIVSSRIIECHGCGKNMTKGYRCSYCVAYPAYYCDSNCQERDWTTHRFICQKYIARPEKNNSLPGAGLLKKESIADASGPSGGASGPSGGASGPSGGASGPSGGASGPSGGASGPSGGAFGSNRVGVKMGENAPWGIGASPQDSPEDKDVSTEEAGTPFDGIDMDRLNEMAQTYKTAYYTMKREKQAIHELYHRQQELLWREEMDPTFADATDGALLRTVTNVLEARKKRRDEARDTMAEEKKKLKTERMWPVWEEFERLDRASTFAADSTEHHEAQMKRLLGNMQKAPQNKGNIGHMTADQMRRMANFADSIIGHERRENKEDEGGEDDPGLFGLSRKLSKDLRRGIVEMEKRSFFPKHTADGSESKIETPEERQNLVARVVGILNEIENYENESLANARAPVPGNTERLETKFQRVVGNVVNLMVYLGLVSDASPDYTGVYDTESSQQDLKEKFQRDCVYAQTMFAAEISRAAHMGPGFVVERGQEAVKNMEDILAGETLDDRATETLKAFAEETREFFTALEKNNSILESDRALDAYVADFRASRKGKVTTTPPSTAPAKPTPPITKAPETAPPSIKRPGKEGQPTLPLVPGKPGFLPGVASVASAMPDALNVASSPLAEDISDTATFIPDGLQPISGLDSFEDRVVKALKRVGALFDQEMTSMLAIIETLDKSVNEKGIHGNEVQRELVVFLQEMHSAFTFVKNTGDLADSDIVERMSKIVYEKLIRADTGNVRDDIQKAAEMKAESNVNWPGAVFTLLLAASAVTTSVSLARVFPGGAVPSTNVHTQDHFDRMNTIFGVALAHLNASNETRDSLDKANAILNTLKNMNQTAFSNLDATSQGDLVQKILTDLETNGPTGILEAHAHEFLKKKPALEWLAQFGDASPIEGMNSTTVNHMYRSLMAQTNGLMKDLFRPSDVGLIEAKTLVENMSLLNATQVDAMSDEYFYSIVAQFQDTLLVLDGKIEAEMEARVTNRKYKETLRNIRTIIATTRAKINSLRKDRDDGKELEDQQLEDAKNSIASLVASLETLHNTAPALLGNTYDGIVAFLRNASNYLEDYAQGLRPSQDYVPFAENAVRPFTQYQSESQASRGGSGSNSNSGDALVNNLLSHVRSAVTVFRYYLMNSSTDNQAEIDATLGAWISAIDIAAANATGVESMVGSESRGRRLNDTLLYLQDAEENLNSIGFLAGRNYTTHLDEFYANLAQANAVPISEIQDEVDWRLRNPWASSVLTPAPQRWLYNWWYNQHIESVPHSNLVLTNPQQCDETLTIMMDTVLVLDKGSSERKRMVNLINYYMRINKTTLIENQAISLKMLLLLVQVLLTASSVENVFIRQKDHRELIQRVWGGLAQTKAALLDEIRTSIKREVDNPPTLAALIVQLEEWERSLVPYSFEAKDVPATREERAKRLRFENAIESLMLANQLRFNNNALRGNVISLASILAMVQSYTITNTMITMTEPTFLAQRPFLSAGLPTIVAAGVGTIGFGIKTYYRNKWQASGSAAGTWINRITTKGVDWLTRVPDNKSFLSYMSAPVFTFPYLYLFHNYGGGSYSKLSITAALIFHLILGLCFIFQTRSVTSRIKEQVEREQEQQKKEDEALKDLKGKEKE